MQYFSTIRYHSLLNVGYMFSVVKFVSLAIDGNKLQIKLTCAYLEFFAQSQQVLHIPVCVRRLKMKMRRKCKWMFLVEILIKPIGMIFRFSARHGKHMAPNCEEEISMFKSTVEIFCIHSHSLIVQAPTHNCTKLYQICYVFLLFTIYFYVFTKYFLYKIYCRNGLIHKYLQHINYWRLGDKWPSYLS